MRRLIARNPALAGAAAIFAAFVALNVVALIVSTVRPEPSGADGSAYATQPRGAAAYAELLRRAGHRVSYERAAVASARLDPATTVVLLDAPALSDSALAALARFVRAGGRLVAGGPDAGQRIVPNAPRWTAAGPRVATPATPVPETAAVRSITSAGEGGFASLGGARAALGERPALLAVERAGRGRALLLADSSPLQNRLLARSDNAALALALAGPSSRAVTFVESVHGFGRRSGLAALPARWRLALAVTVLAALLWLASRARRLGPPEDPGGEPTPARREHVDALALALRRARDHDVALAPVQAAARAQVIARAALAPGAADAAVRDAALALGFEEDEATALIGARDGDDALALGRALARGRR